MTQEKGWLGPYAPADPHQGEKTMDIVDEVKAIFDDKNGIIKQLRKEIHSLKIANRDLLDWYDSSREDATRLLKIQTNIIAAFRQNMMLLHPRYNDEAFDKLVARLKEDE
jgi:hypothetical protein